MMRKSEVRSRLQKLEPLSGVVPTAPQPSELSTRVAKSLADGDIGTAVAASRELLQSLPPETRPQDTTPELLQDPEMREQIAGFANVGLHLFKAEPEFWQMTPAERSARGGNSVVTRVFVQEQRLLLETSRIVVRAGEGASDGAVEEALARHQVRPISSEGLPPRIQRADAPTGNAVETCLALMEEDAIEYAEPDFIEHIGQRLTPNDPDLARQWHHANIRSSEAWDHASGKGIRIAVIDNGFDTAHEDLSFGDASGWFRSSFDLADADFVPGTFGMSDSNHGTACAGMIAAIADNARGGCGVAYGSELSIVACLPDQVGTQVTLARAVAYAAQPQLENHAVPGADIIACSLGPNDAVWTMSAVLSDAIDFAAGQGRDGLGCPIFWACTNGNHPIEFDQVCSHADVMAIGRSTRADSDDGSGFGPKLEFLAPGVDVWIPASGGAYHTTTGTSFAAPCAAGIGALALSRKPDMTAAELRQLLRDTCDKVGPLPYIDGHNSRFGHGRANAEAAVAEAMRLSSGV